MRDEGCHEAPSQKAEDRLKKCALDLGWFWGLRSFGILWDFLDFSVKVRPLEELFINPDFKKGWQGLAAHLYGL